MVDLMAILPMWIVLPVMVVIDFLCSAQRKIPRVISVRRKLDGFKDEYVPEVPRKVSFFKFTHEAACSRILQRVEVSEDRLYPPYSYDSWSEAAEAFLHMSVSAVLQRKAYQLLRTNSKFSSHAETSLRKLRKVSARMARSKVYFETGNTLNSFCRGALEACLSLDEGREPNFKDEWTSMRFCYDFEVIERHTYWRLPEPSAKAECTILSAYIFKQLGCTPLDYFACSSEDDLLQWAVDFAICNSLKAHLLRNSRALVHGGNMFDETEEYECVGVNSFKDFLVESRMPSFDQKGNSSISFVAVAELTTVLHPILREFTNSIRGSDEGLLMDKIISDLVGSNNIDLLVCYHDLSVIETVFWVLGMQSEDTIRDMDALRSELLRDRSSIVEPNERNRGSLLLLAHLGLVIVRGRNSGLFDGTRGDFLGKKRVDVPDASLPGRVLNRLGFVLGNEGGRRILGVPGSCIAYECLGDSGGRINVKRCNVRLRRGTEVPSNVVFGT